MTNNEIKSLIEESYGCKITLDRVHYNEDTRMYEVSYAHCGKKGSCRLSEETKEVENMELGEAFSWYVTEGPCHAFVYKYNAETGNTADKFYDYIGTRTKRIIELALRNDEECTGEHGLAVYMSDELAPYVDKIVCLGIKEGEINEESENHQFKPMVRFLIEGHLPKNMDEETFRENVFDFILGQCSDGWGENFEQHPVKTSMKRNTRNHRIKTELYFSPWTASATVEME